MGAAEITEKLGLHNLRNRNWYIQVGAACHGLARRGVRGGGVIISPASLSFSLAAAAVVTWVQATCATNGEGLYEGLDWLSSQLKNASR